MTPRKPLPLSVPIPASAAQPPDPGQATSPARPEATLDRLPTFITVDELAVLLRMNRKTVYEGIASGDIPGGRRVGRTIRVTRDVVLSWLRGQGHVSRSTGRSR